MPDVYLVPKRLLRAMPALGRVFSHIDVWLLRAAFGLLAALPQRIYDGNVALIRRCDAVVANLRPFRGHVEPDSGTVFEIGMAVALGKPVAAYLPQSGLSYAERVSRHFPTRRDASGAVWDEANGLLVEGFGEPMNLMLSRSTHLFESFEEAVSHVADLLRARAAR